MIATFIRHGSNGALIALAVVLAAAFAFHALTFALGAAALGALIFFGSEYTTHRFLLHAAPQRNAFVLRLQQRLHYDHHVSPTELNLLFLPLWFALPVVALYLLVSYAIARDAGVASSALFGAVLGLAYYEWVHFVAHIAFVPRTPFGRWIKKYHLRHHYLNERYWFGVTNPLVDFGGFTYRKTTEAERSASTRRLFPQ